MNPKTIFKLHEPQHDVDAKHQKDTYVYMYFSYGFYERIIDSNIKKKYVPLKYSTGLRIKPCFWDDRPVYRAIQDSFDAATQFNKRLDYFQESIVIVFKEFESYGLIPTPAQLKDRFDVYIQNDIKKPVLMLNEYIAAYIKDAKVGKRLTTKNKNYRSVSIKNLIGFQVQFSNYQKSKSESLSYDQIDKDFLSDFIQYFRDRNYSQNTISRHVKHLRMFMRSSRSEGLHHNNEIDLHHFRVRQEEVDHIYLNEKELELILNLDLSKKPKLEVVRDVFLIGCYIGQRYSDYKSITKKNIIKLDDNSYAIDLFQTKTGKRIILPLRAEVITLLKKYDYCLPYTYEQQINSKIQEVAKMTGIGDEVIVYVNINGRRVSKKIPRYKLIKTHTARRSACTNMYLANIPINEIMTISGHQTVFDFMKYIRASEIQIAKKLALHPYFSGV